MGYPIDVPSEEDMEAASIPDAQQGELTAGAIMGFLGELERSNPVYISGALTVFMAERQESLGNGDNFRGAAFHAIIEWLQKLQEV